MPKPARTRGKCLTENCVRERQVRGICLACYRAFKRALKRGELTEQEAIERGWILPRHKCVRKNRAWFRAQLSLPFSE